MQVKLRYTWFSPSAKSSWAGTDKRTRSGQRWPAGVHEIPEHLRPHLPKSATVLDDPVKEPAKVAPAPKKAPVTEDK